jgi:hypothetical protein
VRYIISFTTPGLASACPAAAVAQITQITQIELPSAAAIRAQAPSLTERGWTNSGSHAGVVSHRTPAYLPVFVDRPMGDEQTNRTANGGVQGPHYAWREPVTT